MFHCAKSHLEYYHWSWRIWKVEGSIECRDHLDCTNSYDGWAREWNGVLPKRAQNWRRFSTGVKALPDSQRSTCILFCRRWISFREQIAELSMRKTPELWDSPAMIQDWMFSKGNPWREQDLPKLVSLLSFPGIWEFVSCINDFNWKWLPSTRSLASKDHHYDHTPNKEVERGSIQGGILIVCS